MGKFSSVEVDKLENLRKLVYDVSDDVWFNAYPDRSQMPESLIATFNTKRKINEVLINLIAEMRDK